MDGDRVVVRPAGQRYERKRTGDKAATAAAILFREIRERVPLWDDLVGEIVRRDDGHVIQRPRSRRTRRERPA